MLVLHGRELVLEELRLDDRVLEAADFVLEEESLHIPGLRSLTPDRADRFRLYCRSIIEPQKRRDGTPTPTW